MRSLAGLIRWLTPIERPLARARSAFLTVAVSGSLALLPALPAQAQQSGPAPGLLDAPTSVVATPGQTLAISLSAADPSVDGPLSVILDVAPVGVSLERVGDGEWRIVWLTPDDLANTLLVVTAVARTDRTKRSRVGIEVSPTSSVRGGPALPELPEAPPPTPTPTPTPVAEADEPAPADTEPATVPVMPLRLPEIASQQLVVGHPWSLWLQSYGGRAGARIEFETLGTPPGLSTERMDDGWQRLLWTPASSGVVYLELVARDAEQPLIEARRRVRLEVVSVEQSLLPPAGPPMPPEPPEPAIQSSLPERPATGVEVMAQAPQLPVLTHQVVSPGRAVRFKVRPQIVKGQRAIVQIDRLPRNASFDENEDGSRTFYWLTGDRDQGEHRFRLTAINTEDSSLRDVTDVVVTVGDPSRGKTVPAD